MAKRRFAGSLLPGRNWLGVCIVSGACVVLGLTGEMPAAAAQGADVCGRTDEVGEAIVAAAGIASCSDLALRDMREITSLDLRDAGMETLRDGDFDGLVRLESLDLSDNLLSSLPHGIFDELYLLKSLRLDGNALASLPDGIFDELFLLEEVALDGNLFTALPDDLFDEFSRFDGMQANGDPPNDSGDYRRIQRFLDRHAVTSPEEFVAALPLVYRERFVLMYKSGAAAAEHVSSGHPRVISWGAHGHFTFAWNTDPDAPEPFRDSVEFLRQDDTAWTAGVIDFSSGTPEITEPESCATCHGGLNKPLWGIYPEWEGSEYDYIAPRVAYMEAVLESTDPRITPLEFPDAGFRDGDKGVRYLVSPHGEPVMAAVEEAGAVWSKRQLEVLLRVQKNRDPEVRSWAERAVCDGWAIHRSFAPEDHHLLVLANAGVTTDDAGVIVSGLSSHVHPGVSDLLKYSYKYHDVGTMADAWTFLAIAELWRAEPVVRRLYRNTLNGETVAAGTVARLAKLHYAPGSATAEDELIEKLRQHFGRGGLPALDARERQNARFSQGGSMSAIFGDGHVDAMGPLVCEILAGSVPGGAVVALEDGDAVLSWDAPTHDAHAVTGYRILRGVDGAAPAVRVADTGSTDTNWTDDGPPPGDYVYAVKALYEDYYASPGSNAAAATVPDLALSAAPAAVEEGGASTLSITSLSGALAEDRTIALRVSGTAAASDYEIAVDGQTLASPYTLRLAAGAVAVAATVGAVDDDIAEPDETVTLTASHDGGDIGSATVTILASDTPPSDDANLAGLVLSGVDIGTFSAATTSYDVDVVNGVTATTVTATPSNAGAGVVIADADGSTAGTTRTVSLAEGSNTITVTVTAADGVATKAYAVTVTRAAALLTAAFEDVPASHDGTSPFTFTLRFSEPIRNSYRTLRDRRLGVENGTATRARRVNGSSAVWSIEVTPSGTEDIAVTLTRGGACRSGGVCTADGRRLSGSVNAAVPGPRPSVSIAAGATAAEGSAALFTLDRGGATAGSLTVSVSVTETGAMLTGAVPATATFDAGTGTATLRAETSDDRVSEASSVVTATVLAGSGYTVSAPSSADVTVTDDDEASFSLSAQPEMIDEGGSSTLTVSTGGVSFADPQMIDLAVASGTASTGDYALSPAALTLVAGSTLATSTLTAVDDATAEPDETATVSASHGGAAVASATVTILASDAPSDDAALAALSLSGIDIGAFSAATTNYAADISNDVSGTTVAATPNDPNASVEVEDPDGGAADLPAGGTRPVALAVGSNTIKVTVTAEDDTTTRTYTVTVTRAAAALTASFEDLPASHDGATAFTFTLRFSEPIGTTLRTLRDESLAVGNGSATRARRVSGSSAVWSIKITPSGTADTTVSLSADRACDAGGACTADGRRLSESVSATIAGPSPSVSISAGAAVSEGSPALFTLDRGGATAAALTVSVSVSETGSMLSGAPPGTASFGAGDSSTTLTIATSDDTVSEAASVVTATVLSGSGYTVSSPSSADVSVADDDVPSFSVSANPGLIDEGGSSTLTVSTGGATFAAPQTISLSSGGTASGADYTLSPAALSLPAGSTSATATLSATDDSVEEAAETVTVTASRDGSAIGSATVTIVANDAPVPPEDATLAALTLSGIDFGAFSSETTSYDADVANDVASTLVTATPKDAQASVMIADAGGSTTGTNRNSALAVGANIIAVMVTAGETTRTYTVTVTRAESAAAWGERRPARDIDLGAGADVSGLWSDGETMWVVTDYYKGELRAYQLATGDREPSADIALDRRHDYVSGVWSDGETLWAADPYEGVYAYRLSDGGRVPAEDFGAALSAAGNDYPTALWSDGDTMWVSDNDDGKVYAYALSDKSRRAEREFSLREGVANMGPFGLWSDGDTLLASYLVNGSVHGYGLGDGGRRSERDIDTASSGNYRPIGLWSDGATLWVADGSDGRVYAYAVPGLRVAQANGASAASARDAWVSGTALTLRYDGALDGGSTPSGGDFALLAGGSGGEEEVAVTSVAVHGDAVSLTLARPVLPEETVRLGYLAAPMHPVQDARGRHTTPLEDLAVRNETRRAGASGAVDAVVSLRKVTSPPTPEAEAILPVPPDLSPWPADRGASAPFGRLDLSSRRVVDISALAGLTELRVLNLEDNAIADLLRLSELTGLRVLDLSDNAIEDVGPLSGLSGLSRLDLSGNRIADISALSGLTGLKVLLLDGNRIEDVVALWSLQELVHLGLSDNRIADVGLLAELASLKRLDLAGNRVSDVSPLGDLRGLVWLRLPGNPVSDLSPMGRLTRLRWLWLDPEVRWRGPLEAHPRRSAAPLWIGGGTPAPERVGDW